MNRHLGYAATQKDVDLQRHIAFSTPLSFFVRGLALLSYRHSFHAGNFADILKHIVVVEIFEHLVQKEKPFEYIDTHAGAGLFNFSSREAQKLQEHAAGIARLVPEEFPELARYFEIIGQYNKSEKLIYYPGSPLIAKYFLRQQDRAWLYELHPQDYNSLRTNIGKHKKIRVACEDGFKALNALLPPVSRRGLVLIDPAYEVKSDYDRVFSVLAESHRKFSTGIFAIWYPVVDREKIDRLDGKLMRSGIKNIQRFELGLASESPGYGMTSSGLFVVNPPWTLFDTMSRLLPRLARVLGENSQPIYRCDILTDENGAQVR